MDKSQIELVKLLNKALISEKIDVSEDIDWNELIDISSENKVEAIMYSAISNKSKENISKEILDDLKKRTFQSGIGQLNHMKAVSNVLTEFNKENISVLVLKGLVIRDMYPTPTLRTMSDADIVVKEKDLEKSKQILENLGYSEYSSSPSHFVYYKPGYLLIELHWNLADEHFFNNIDLFEEDMWPNVIDVNIEGVPALGMSLEDLAIYQSIHMAKHFVYRGFGIRHLVDFVLLVQKKGTEVDWTSFINRCYKYGIGKFTVAMFMACRKLFDIEVPDAVLSRETCSEAYVDALIEDIFSGGVHGKHDFTSAVASEFAYTSDKDSEVKESVSKKFLRFLFPPVENMSDKYDYARKNKILTPVAWVHHLFAGVFNSEYSLKDKFKFTTSVLVESKKRNDLMEWLEL